MSWTLNTWFENFIFFCIIVSMCLLCLDNPNNDPNGSLSKHLEQVDNFIAFVFFSEAILRIMSTGFFVSSIPGKKGYIRKGQNKIDFTVSILVDMTIIIAKSMEVRNFTYFVEMLKSLKALRTLRALRPLRLIGRSDALRIAIGSLSVSLPAIFNGIVVCSLIIFIYAIIGISFFKGKFMHCAFDLKT